MKDKTGKTLTTGEVVNKGGKRIATVWLEFMNYILYIIGFVPVHHVRRFFYRLCGAKIGKGTSLHMNIVWYNPHNVIIGQDTIIGEKTVLDGRARLEIGNHVDIASEVMIYNSQHDMGVEHFAAVESVVNEPVIIEDYVFIGPRAIILPGITIGKGAVVGAGAVVTKDVPAFQIVGGVPSKEIGQRKNNDLHYKLGRAAWFR